MAEKHLHIVSFDVPFPADYGVAVDVFYKIKALYDAGILVHLHCFEYGRGIQPELEKFCKEVHYYPRQEGHKGFSLQLPYIVSSRHDEILWKRLNDDPYPVLFEGVHTTYGITSGIIRKKNVAIRIHNTEHEYYKQLGKWEGSVMRKAYMLHESRLLKRYEETLKDYKIFAISEDDAKKYKQQFKAKNAVYIPAFIPNTNVTSIEGTGTFVLYHGNLSVPENEKAAVWLLEKIFNNLEIPFVIAGKNPSSKLISIAHKQSHTCIVANPGEKEMADLIEKAQVHVFPVLGSTGSSIKLLHSLFSGKHIIANTKIIANMKAGSCCQAADNITEFKYHIYRLFHKPFTATDIERRTELLSAYYNNNSNAGKITGFFFESE